MHDAPRMRCRSPTVPRSMVEKSHTGRGSFVMSRGRNVSVCTHLSGGPPTRRFRISCKGKPAENRGVPVVCRPTHPKAGVAMESGTKREEKEGIGGKCKGVYLLPINGRSGGLSCVQTDTRGHEDRVRRRMGGGAQRGVSDGPEGWELRVHRTEGRLSLLQLGQRRLA